MDWMDEVDLAGSAGWRPWCRAGVGTSAGALAGLRAGAIAWVGRRGGSPVSVAERARSGETGKRADRRRADVELILPEPAGWHPEGPLAAGVGQAAGDLKEVAAAAGSDGLDRQVSEGDPVAQLSRVSSM